MFKTMKIAVITPILMGFLGGLKGNIVYIRAIDSSDPAYPYLSFLVFGSYVGCLAGSCITWLFASAIYGIAMDFFEKEKGCRYENALIVVGISLVPLMSIQCLDLIVAAFSYSFPFTIYLLLTILSYVCMFSLVRRLSLDMGYCNRPSIVGGIIAPFSYYIFNFVATIISLRIGGVL